MASEDEQPTRPNSVNPEDEFEGRDFYNDPEDWHYGDGRYPPTAKDPNDDIDEFWLRRGDGVEDGNEDGPVEEGYEDGYRDRDGDDDGERSGGGGEGGQGRGEGDGAEGGRGRGEGDRGRGERGKGRGEGGQGRGEGDGAEGRGTVASQHEDESTGTCFPRTIVFLDCRHNVYTFIDSLSDEDAPSRRKRKRNVFKLP